MRNWNKGVKVKTLKDLVKPKNKRGRKEKIDNRCFTCDKEDCKGKCEIVR